MSEGHPPIETSIEYPIINPAFVPVKVDENTVHLRVGPWNGAKHTIEDEDGDGQLEEFVTSLDGGTHVTEILDRFDQADEIEQFLRHLYRKNIIIDAAASDVDRRVHGYLLASDAVTENTDRLEESTVLVVGGGPMAEQVATDLSDVGVGTVTYRPLGERDQQPFDQNDAVTTSNADPAELVEDADFMAAAIDHHHSAVLDELNRVAEESDTPWIVGRNQGIDGQVGPLVIPGESSCYECFKQRRWMNLNDPHRVEQYERQGADAANESMGAFPPFARIVGGYVALDVINYLSRGLGITAGRMVSIHFPTFNIDVNEVLRLPRCDVCGIDDEAEPEHDEYLTLQNLHGEIELGGGDD